VKCVVPTSASIQHYKPNSGFFRDFTAELAVTSGVQEEKMFIFMTDCILHAKFSNKTVRFRSDTIKYAIKI